MTMPITFYVLVYSYPRWTGPAKVESETAICHKIFKSEEEARAYHKENMFLCDIIEVKPVTLYEGEPE
jgi:hypothetical protein